MSTLSQLRISGVRSFDPDEEQKIKFETPITLILGQNGCGKTSIIESVKYAITGELPLGTKNGQGFIHDPQMCHKSESRAQVKLRIHDLRGDPITIQKVAKVTQIASGLRFQSMPGSISRGNESISNRCVDLHQEMCRSMGVSKAILNNVIFCHQEDSYWPMEEPKKLKERFDKIFDSAKYNYCIDKLIKIKKLKGEKLRDLAKDVEIRKRDKVQMEKKKDQLQEKKNRRSEMMERKQTLLDEKGPLLEKRENIIRLEGEVTKVQTKLDTLKSKIELNEQQQEDILKSIKELDITDEELENRIDSFQSNTEKIQGNINKLEEDMNSIEQTEENSREEMSKDHISLGKLQEEFKQHQCRIKDQETLINTIQTDFDIFIPRNLEGSERIEHLEKKLEDLENEIIDFEKKNEEKEKKLQDEIDECRTKYTQLSHEVSTKTKQLEELEKEKKDVTKKLTELNAYDGQLSNIQSRLKRTDNDLNTLETQINIPKLREEIENEKSKYDNLEDQLQKVDREIQTLQNYASIQTELDVHQENLLKKQKDKRELYYKHEPTLETIFNYDIPEDNLKPALEKISKREKNLIDITSHRINDKEKEVNKMEAGLNVQKEKLRQMKGELERNKTTIDAIYQGKSFEEVEENIKDVINELQAQKGEYINSIQMYRKFIQSFKKEKPCCPVCNRDVKERNQTNLIIEDIESKIGGFPQLAKDTELKLVKELEKQAKILELKPMYFKIIEMETKELPILKKNVADQEKNYNYNVEKLEVLKNELIKPKKIQDLINSLIGDATLIDQYNLEIKNLQNDISTLKSQMPSTETSRSIQDAYFEQENLKASTKESLQKMQTLTDKLNKHTDRVQQLNAQRNELKTKELTMKQELQEKEHLEIKRNEISQKISELTKQRQESKQQIEPLQENLDKAHDLKIKYKREYKTKKTEKDNHHKCFDRILKDMSALQKQIEKVNNKNIEQTISSVTARIKQTEKSLENYLEQKSNITNKIDGLKDQMLNKKSYFRELVDNKKLREKRVELKILMAQQEELEKELVDHDPYKFRQAKQKLEQKIIDIQTELSQLNGKLSELDKAIEEAKKELSEPIYANAGADYRKKLIECKLIGHYIKDIEAYIRAVDWAMVQYHKQQMVYINETICDLWRSIYRGNDIDYIEIKTEIEKSRSNDKRRIYQYRLVQVKNDVEIEMRGRCSAGQKVLASLVIRIALADTFSTKCGVLALDEPTTNLDKENIGSLCDALSELINKKRFQKSFQLLIITHDQDFLEKLSRTVLMENYIYVTRNDYGKSVITVKPVNF